jgi:hypothetical protein
VKGFSKTAITGFELDESEAAKSEDRARQAGLKNAAIRSEDLLGWALIRVRGTIEGCSG